MKRAAGKSPRAFCALDRVAGVAPAQPAAAQEYLVRPIRMLISLPAGRAGGFLPHDMWRRGK